jgi:phenylacetate-CoA ligase
MHDLTLAVYHRLPSPVQSLAATCRGSWLRRWRYGPETESLMAEAQARESWSVARWTGWREERLAQLLDRAATRVPYYREHWAERRRRGDRRPWDRLEHWPILDKESLRATPARFVADDCNIARMFHDHTSGTSGKSLDVWLSRDTVRGWYALFELRCRVWHGVAGHDRWAILGGQLVVPVLRRKPPFWVWNAALNQLYCSSYHLAPVFTPRYLDALQTFRISYLCGYPSALYELAEAALRIGRDDIRLRVAITNAEPLFDYQRKAIASAFHCQVRESYGMTEIAAAASECEAGRLHEWPEAGLMEVVDEHGQVESGVAGELVATGLLNGDMPLIRYRVGDRIARGAGATNCPCGRRLPIVKTVEGRSDDTLYTRDGRRIGRLDPIFKRGLAITEAQIVQEALDRITVRYVPLPEFDAAAGRRLESAIRARLGDVQVVLEPLTVIPRGVNGKFRAVVCMIPAADRPSPRAPYEALAANA